MKLPEWASLTWLTVKILVFMLMSLQTAEIVVVAYQQF